MNKIGIIGGGASALVAAIYAKKKDNEVIIFERNKECGKKILVTGNGRCNYWNSDQSLLHYQSSEPNLIKELINTETEKNVIEFFNKLGIVPKIKNGYYYPFSNQASTIKKVLIDEVKKLNIKIKNNFLVEDIELINNQFLIISNNEKVIVDKVIMATGSKAFPKTGSDGMGYSLLKKLGHNIINPLPSLVQLKSNGDYLKIWNGVRTEAKVTLVENEKKIREELGEIQLTNYGISGICVFNLSNHIARGLDSNKEEVIFIDFLPFIDDSHNWFINQSKITNKNIKEMLSAILNEKIVEVIFIESKVSGNKLFCELSKSDQERLISYCRNFKLVIKATNSFNEAQVCSGGVKLSEINLKTMESRLINNLYIIGELLDLTGDCGGYNLGICWRTAINAGISISGEDND